MTLQELGQFIREQREAAGMSVSDVSARIKISARILKSIEEGSMVGMPHAVYTKSFIRAFGLHVGCDPEVLNPALEALFPPESLDETRSEPTFKAHAAMQYPGGAGKRFAALLVILLILGGLAGGGWYVAVTYGDQILELVKRPFSAVTSPTEGEPARQNQEPAPATSSRAISQTLQVLSDANRPAQQDAPLFSPGRGAPPEGAAPTPGAHLSATSPAPAQAGVDASGEAAGLETSDLSQTRSDGASPAEPEESSPADASAAASAAADAAASPPVTPHKLLIRAAENCWVASKADGASGRDYTLRPGEQIVLTYAKTLEVVFGNAGGVTLEHNGKTIGSPGQKGRRAVVRFPEAGR